MNKRHSLRNASFISARYCGPGKPVATRCTEWPARLASVVIFTALAAAFSAHAADTTGAKSNDAETTSGTYELKYKYQRDEVIKTHVVHVATTETKIRGNTQSSNSRSVSTKVWRIKEVNEDGSITFEHSVANVEMRQQVSDRPEIKYNSESDKVPPPEFEAVAETIGVPLDTITIDKNGTVLKRNQPGRQASLGLGDIAIPLPAGKVRIGHKWESPDEVFVRQEDGKTKRIAIRKEYTLEQVKTGVATIRVETQVLTPAVEPRLQAQLVQQLTDGTIRFDLDAGRLISRQMDWDKTVVSFDGADSMMKYLARYTESQIGPDVDSEPSDKAAAKEKTAVRPIAGPPAPPDRR